MSEESATSVAEQVATPAQEPSTAPEVKEDAPHGEESQKPEPTESDKQKAYERRIARQTAANRQTQRQFEEERAARLAVEKRLAEYEAKQPLADKPSKDNFDTEDEYTDALVDWKLAQKEKEASKPKEPSVEDRVKQELASKEFEQTFRQKEEAFKATTPDYEKATQVVNGLLKYADPNHDSTKAFSTTLLNAPNPPAIIHYLGTHPDEAIAMMTMSPFEIQDRLGIIIDGLDAPKQTASEETDEAPSKQADLPKPPSSLTGAAKVSKPLYEKSGEDIVKWALNK